MRSGKGLTVHGHEARRVASNGAHARHHETIPALRAVGFPVVVHVNGYPRLGDRYLGHDVAVQYEIVGVPFYVRFAAGELLGEGVFVERGCVGRHCRVWL